MAIGRPRSTFRRAKAEATLCNGLKLFLKEYSNFRTPPFSLDVYESTIIIKLYEKLKIFFVTMQRICFNSLFDNVIQS